MNQSNPLLALDDVHDPDYHDQVGRCLHSPFNLKERLIKISVEVSVYNITILFITTHH